MFKFLILIALLVSSHANANNSAELTILSEGFSLHSNLVDDFKLQYGVEVVVLDQKFDDNLARLQYYNQPDILSGKNSVKPDLIIAKDLVYLTELKKQGFTKSFNPLSAFSEIKEGMMDTKDLNWIGLTFRARTLAYGSNVDVSSINSYEDLASPEWAGRICLRTSSNSYNQGLIAYLVTKHGQEKARKIMAGWVNNLAAPVYSKDGLILNALNSGECEVGLVNHYYLAREYAKAQAEGTKFNVELKFLDQENGGVHVNGYGVALLKTTQNQDLAERFVEMLLTEKAQLQISYSQFAYPVIKNLNSQSLVQIWGEFKTSPLIWSEIGDNLDLANELAKDVNYN